MTAPLTRAEKSSRKKRSLAQKMRDYNAKRATPDLPVDREQHVPVERETLPDGTVRVTFGKGWNVAAREPKRLPSMHGYQSSLDRLA
jgi:hypothetical protein